MSELPVLAFHFRQGKPKSLESLHFYLHVLKQGPRARVLGLHGVRQSKRIIIYIYPCYVCLEQRRLADLERTVGARPVLICKSTVHVFLQLKITVNPVYFCLLPG